MLIQTLSSHSKYLMQDQTPELSHTWTRASKDVILSLDVGSTSIQVCYMIAILKVKGKVVPMLI
jgi:hypothetical protein